MTNLHPTAHVAHHESPDTSRDRISLGFWIYIMSDCVLFAALFAAYAVLHTATAGGPSARELFDRPYVLAETLLLLTSSFTCGLALVALRSRRAFLTWLALGATFLLGAGFLALELHEFAGLVASGHSWTQSAFLSSFFTLVGTHGLHITIGLIWLLALGIHLGMQGTTKESASRLLYFSLFWHFLDIVWICIFSLVYLFGSL